MLSDEMLGAYLDGELDPEQRGLVDRQVSADPLIAGRLQRLRRSDEALRAAIPRLATAPDDPVLAMLTGGPPRAGRGLRERVMQAAALAAACLIGVFGGRAFAPEQNLTAPWALGDPLVRTLDETPSGERVQLGDSEIVIGFTLRDGDGEVCRQFNVVSTGEVADALACREDGSWRLRVQSLSRAEEGYTVAAASSPIDAAIAGMNNAAVLDLDAERALMASGWR
jgi:hypothetical protein